LLMVLGEPLKKWKCTYKSCGALCCKVRREVTPTDVRRIIQATGMSPEKFTSISADESRRIPFTLKRRRGNCIFLGEKYECQLHRLNAKPILCRMYPFLLKRVIYADELIMQIKPAEGCPGYGKGPRFGRKAEREVAANARAFIKDLRKVAQQRRQGIKPEEILKRVLNR